MSQRLDDAISYHTTEWFHRACEGDDSPALTLRNMSNSFLRYLAETRLKLAVPEETFRKFMCEAVCTMYISAKQGTQWQGPNSIMSRPSGWSYLNEIAWREYLSYMYFGSEFWTDFWNEVGDSTAWEYVIPNWRCDMERILPHYIFCNPKLFSGGAGGAGGSSSSRSRRENQSDASWDFN